MRLGIIGGNGWIGGAIARAVAAGLVPAAELTLSCRGAPPDWPRGARWTHDNQELADRSDLVILSVRPPDWPAIRVAAPGRLVVSVMAGVTLGDIATRLGTDRVVRALPNAAAEVGRSYTPWTASPGVTGADRAMVRRLIEAIGSGDELATEAEVDYMTGSSGTGPAYPALLASAMIRDAVAHGLPEEVARRSAIALLIGTGRLLEKTGENPEDTVRAFVDYRGVTAAAIAEMRARGFDAAVSSGLAAALEKSRALGAAGSAPS